MRDVLAGRRLRTESDTPVVTKCFPRETRSVPEVRRFARTALMEWGLPDLADNAETVTAELASNAILHARHSAIRVTLSHLSNGQVQVAVIDRSRTLPRQTDPDNDEDHGRGLAIVDALSHNWGAEPMWWGSKKGKKVWAVLVAPEPTEPPEPYIPMYPSRRAQVVYVLIVLAVAAFLVAAVGAQR